MGHKFFYPLFVESALLRETPWQLWKIQGKQRNCEPPVLTNCSIDSTHQIVIDQTWPTGTLFIRHRYAAFVELPSPPPDHSITNGIFTIHLTKLTMNGSWFDVSRIQETDNRPYLTVGGVLNHFKHFNWSVITNNHTYGLKLWNLHAKLVRGLKKKTHMAKLRLQRYNGYNWNRNLL